MNSSNNQQMGFWAALLPIAKSVGVSMATSAATNALAPKPQPVYQQPVQAAPAPAAPQYMKYLPLFGAGVLAVMLLKD